MTATPLLTANGLAWELASGVRLGPVDLAVRRGECFVLVGPNGAGKTTLLRTLVGLLRPAAGEVLLTGLPQRALWIAADPPARPDSRGVLLDSSTDAVLPNGQTVDLTLRVCSLVRGPQS